MSGGLLDATSISVGRLSLQELVCFAREHSPFYRDLYRHLPEWRSNRPCSIEELPFTDQALFWRANTIQDNRLLTGAQVDGIVFKSGGTTGSPKCSYYSRQEWHHFTLAFGKGLVAGGLEAGERIGNLFYAGELYASFTFIMKSIEQAPVGAVQFPLAGSASFPDLAKAIKDFGITTLAGVPTSLLSFAENYHRERAAWGALPVRKILFGGETLYEDQRRLLAEVFPQARMISIGYASVDAGLLGFADQSCGLGEHRVFDEDTIVELIDEDTSQPISEQERPGKLFVTNLTRTLMPIIRYPAGDRAVWTEPQGTPQRKFRLLGRSEEAARIGPVSLYYEDVRELLQAFQIASFQMVLNHSEQRDRLTLRVVAPRMGVNSSKIINVFHENRPMFAQAVAEGRIHELSLEWTEPSGLEVNARTGKLKRIIDRRF